MSKQIYRVCFCFKRRFNIAFAEAPPGVRTVFDEYSENGVMYADHFRRFLIEVQGEKAVTQEEAQALMDTLREPIHLSLFHKRGIYLQAFFSYLFGELNPPLDPKLRVHHDMNAPLSHYFIYTGHNSYLTGNQLSSECSDVPIIRALQRGVRVIELDIWPNSTKDDIDVLHGRTLTTPVSFLRCLRSIKDHAFDSSDFPVIITLEDHLTHDLQAKAAEMITQTFEGMLFAPGPDGLSVFPSPEFLKRKVMISTKPPKEYLKADESQDFGSSKRIELFKKDSSRKESKGPGTKREDSKVKDDHAVDYEGHEDDAQNPSSQLTEVPEYKGLIAIHASKIKGGMGEKLRIDPDKVRRLSLSEQNLEKAILTHGQGIVRFTQTNLLRVYPKGTRFNSSNYDPFIGWTHGAQMVAFNMQGYGKALWLMHGMFKANGGCGYLKKPDFLLNSHDIFDPTTSASLPVKTTLRVSIFMGQGWRSDFEDTHFDLYSPPDFYTKVGIAGVAADTTSEKTKTIEDNWIPTWDQVFEFPLRVPELALLRVQVREYDMSEKDDFAGQTCLPISELRQGIRAVPLYSEKGEKYPSVKLLMRFEFLSPCYIPVY